MKSQVRSFSDFFRIYGVAILVSLAALAAAIWWMEPAPPSTLRLASGAPGGVYHRWGEDYRRLLARQNIEVELIETAGAVDNLTRLASGDVDVAFIQAGLQQGSADAPVTALASIGAEPSWFFVTGDIQSLRDLDGATIAGGFENSGTLAFTRRVVSLAGLTETTEILLIGGNEAVDAIRSGQVEAAVFVSNDVTAPIDLLLRERGIRLLSFEDAQGLARRNPWLSRTALFSGSVDYRNRIPGTSIDLLSTTALLASSERLHPAFVDVLLPAAEIVHGRATLFSDLGEYPQEPRTEMAVNQSATRYFKDGPTLLRRYLPFWAASFVERAWVLVLPLLTIMFPLFKIAPPTYQWRVKSRINRFYFNLDEIEESLNRNPAIAELNEMLATVQTLDKEAASTTVPVTYMNDLYHLRRHISLIESRIRSQIEGTPTTSSSPSSPGSDPQASRSRRLPAEDGKERRGSSPAA